VILRKMSTHQSKDLKMSINISMYPRCACETGVMCLFDGVALFCYSFHHLITNLKLWQHIKFYKKYICHLFIKVLPFLFTFSLS
jgi:hypothetical protein